MPHFPETHQSLLIEIRDPDNREAWERFVEIYQLVIFRSALAWGLQHSDAHDLSQEVLFSVAKAIGKWDATRGNMDSLSSVRSSTERTLS